MESPDTRERPRRKRLAILIAGIALTLIVLDITGIAGTAPRPHEAAETTTTITATHTSTIYTTQTGAETETHTEPGATTETTSRTTSHTSSATASQTSTEFQPASTITSTVSKLENWMLFVSLDPQPSFTASGIWRINQTTVGALIVLVGNFTTHLVPYRAVVNLTITGPGIHETLHQHELPLNGDINRRTTAYELTFSRVNPPEDAEYGVTIHFQREDGATLKALGWNTVDNQVYQEVLLTLQDKPPWEA